jgi:hypothetical protein
VAGITELARQGCMIKNSVRESRCSRMTEIAFLSRGHMVRRFRNRTHHIADVVTRRTGGDDSGMIHR